MISIFILSSLNMPSETAKQYPDVPDIVEEGELTMEELKEAFRFFSHKKTHNNIIKCLCLKVI